MGTIAQLSNKTNQIKSNQKITSFDVKRRVFPLHFQSSFMAKPNAAHTWTSDNGIPCCFILFDVINKWQCNYRNESFSNSSHSLIVVTLRKTCWVLVCWPSFWVWYIRKIAQMLCNLIDIQDNFVSKQRRELSKNMSHQFEIYAVASVYFPLPIPVIWNFYGIHKYQLKDWWHLKPHTLHVHWNSTSDR